MAEREKKMYYLISWVRYNTLRGRLTQVVYYTDISDQHPVEFLIEAKQAQSRENRHFSIALLGVWEFEATAAQVTAWKKKLDV